MYLNYHDLDANIIIIGAGLTGLSTAFHLLERDPHMDLLILDVDEKWDSLVIRQESSLLNTKRMNNNQNSKKRRKLVTFEDEFSNRLGSQYVCSMQKDMLRLLKYFGINVTKNVDKHGNILVDYHGLHEVRGRDQIFSFLSIQDSIALKLFCKQIDQLCEKVSFNYPKDNEPMTMYDCMNMQVFLDNLVNKKIIRDIISQTFHMNSGLQPRDVSALFFLAYCNSTQGIVNQFHMNTEGLYQFRIDGGAEHLRSKFIEIIGDEYIVKVPKVTQMSWDDTSVGIQTSSEYFFANRAIYTLSEAESKNINFVPPLPRSKKEISENSIRGRLKKFGVIYEKPFWRNKDLSGDVYVMDTESKNGPIQICLNISEEEEGKYILMGLANKKGRKSDILQQLSIYFGQEATEPKHYAENDSSLLDLNFPLGFVTLNHFESIRSPVERIVWSSPETAINWYGCLSGSIEAGFIGAIRLLRDIRPTSFAHEDFQLVQPNMMIIPPRRLGLFGFYWHTIIPTALIVILVIYKLKNYFMKKVPLSHR